MSMKPVVRQLKDALDAASDALRNISGMTKKHVARIDADVARRRATDDEAAGRARVDILMREFKQNRRHDSNEFRAQRDEQLDALENISLADWLKNRKEYKENGRPPASLAAQQAARDSAERNKIAELINSGMDPATARTEAADWMSTQAALHRLDGIAGGDVTDISRVGDSRVNSSLGSQWRSRIKDIEAQVDAFVALNPDVDLSSVYINIGYR